ncbi:PH domain-containing protein [Faecalibacterium prausnitzii]|nr:PH domain-containing protein [Faecalibacterium prausnitzii]
MEPTTTLKGDRTMEFRDKPMQNLIRIKEKEICKNVQALLLDGETIVGAYKTVRDQAVFTSHRIFLVDMQGVTGTRQEIFVLPYRKVLHFGVQTAGFGDPLQTSELTVCFADEHEAKFGFIGQDELLNVARAISRCIL